MTEITLLEGETVEDVLESTLNALDYEREEREQADELADAYRLVMHDLLRG